MNEKYHTYISSKKRWYKLNLKEVWQYRDLIVLFTKRTFALTYKQTVLSPNGLSIFYTLLRTRLYAIQL